MKFNTPFDRDLSPEVICESLDYDTVLVDDSSHFHLEDLVRAHLRGEHVDVPKSKYYRSFDFEPDVTDDELDDSYVDPTVTARFDPIDTIAEATEFVADVMKRSKKVPEKEIKES